MSAYDQVKTIFKYVLDSRKKRSRGAAYKRNWAWTGPRGKQFFGTNKALARLVWERNQNSPLP